MIRQMMTCPKCRVTKIERRFYRYKRGRLVGFYEICSGCRKVGGKARGIVRMAIKKGELQPRPCEICGSMRNIHAHHDDYERPLDIRWLCASCHIRLHKGMFPLTGALVIPDPSKPINPETGEPVAAEPT